MRGEVVYLYAFDVANEIVTDKIGDLLASRPLAFESHAERAFPRDVPLYKPFTIELPPLATTLAGKPLALLARIYEVGVISIVFRVVFETESLAGPATLSRAGAGRWVDARRRGSAAMRPNLREPQACADSRIGRVRARGVHGFLLLRRGPSIRRESVAGVQSAGGR